MDLYERNGNILYILNILKKYSDEDHPLKISKLQEYILKDYGQTIDSRTIRRNIALLKEKFSYQISTHAENKVGYYYEKDIDTDFEPGEIRAIIDTFGYATFIDKTTSKNIIKKCKNMQNVFENEKLANYTIYSESFKTQNYEVTKNIEDLSLAIHLKKQVTMDYYKYSLEPELVFKKVKTFRISPLAIIYSIQELYCIALNEESKKIITFRIDRMKNIEVLNKKRSKSISKEEIDNLVNAQTSMYGSKGEKIQVLCKNELLDNAVELYGKESIEYADKNHFFLSVNKDRSGFIRYILRNLDSIDIISPLNLKKDVKDIINMYQERGG